MVATVSLVLSSSEAAGEKAQQLTIFYGGKVVVFENFPSTKVKDLLQIVSTGDGVDKNTGTAATQSLPRPAHNSLPGNNNCSFFCSFTFYHHSAN